MVDTGRESNRGHEVLDKRARGEYLSHKIRSVEGPTDDEVNLLRYDDAQLDILRERSSKGKMMSVSVVSKFPLTRSTSTPISF